MKNRSVSKTLISLVISSLLINVPISFAEVIIDNPNSDIIDPDGLLLQGGGKLCSRK